MYKKRGNKFSLNKFLSVIFLVLLLAACEKSPGTETNTETGADTEPLVSNTQDTLANASLPNLFKDETGLIWMSYVSQAETISSLWLTHWHGDNWAAPELVAQGEHWFVNWADFPSVIKNADGFVAHWLQKNGSGTYAYGVQYATKTADGQWQPRGLLHTDTSPTEHGFVALHPGEDGTHAVWLDGRNMQADGQAAGGHDSHASPVSDDAFNMDSVTGMTLRYGLIASDGRVSERQELDTLTCDCCQTTTAMSEKGLVVAYRDRVVNDAKSEIRDIKILRHSDSGWRASNNTPVDNWDLQACPVNGPTLVAQGSDLGLVWFTAADQQPKVQVAFSADNGESFAPAIDVDAQNNLGRVSADWVDENTLVVTWLGLHEGEAQLLSRLVTKTGERQAIQTVASMDMSRGSGFPQVASLPGGEVMLVWTQTGKLPAIHTKIYKTH